MTYPDHELTRLLAPMGGVITEDILRDVIHDVVDVLELPMNPPWMRNEAHVFVITLDETLRARGHVKELAPNIRMMIGQFAANMCNTQKQLKRMGFTRKSVVLR